MYITRRPDWGFKGWTKNPPSRPISEVKFFVVHYDGGTPTTATGCAIPRRIDAEHKKRRWSGIGYHFVVSQSGQIFEGRGWDLVGAHCPGKNRTGIGVQIHIGGDQKPSPAALDATHLLLCAAAQEAGHPLTVTTHGEHYPTECPGGHLTRWVHAGCPTHMEAPTMDLASAVPDGTTGSDGMPLTYAWLLLRIRDDVAALRTEVAALTKLVDGHG